ncbi:ribosome assembly cofactor RimP [Ichthyenterobacterium sp. W332]|uniref:Ribosome maturation factor RimP n=1 Tax=Microcosmobacter mediterraneus TaxID=3075607 RepID=A0ABU2YHU4_9FLAO|nr:ribosome assembly cofactor RimP [Ichthyenterobacterium sp. W332]MDT0557739.1 ribosome assembly cofactor RimP [Ichthyenterobacterium sp. W332]
MFRDKVESLLQDGLDQRPDLFLIDFEVNESNAIRVVIDGDKGVLVEDCMFISRAIEHNLDREEHDFSLEVTSAGAASDLTNHRQYKKNVGRVLSVKTETGDTYEAELMSATDHGIELTWKAREPKPIGKGKVTVTKEAKLSYEEIKQAKVKIKF